MLCGQVHTSYCQSTIEPPASRPARTDISIAEPNGSQPNSSSRIHCTLTIRPSVATDIKQRIERDVVGAVVAVTSRALRMDHAHSVRPESR